MEVTGNIDETVSITGLKSSQVHEILEKLAFSLKRKDKRDFGPITDYSIYEVVIKLRPLFHDSYGLSQAVDRILEEIHENNKNQYPDLKLT